MYQQLKENGFEVLSDFDLKIGDPLNSLNNMIKWQKEHRN